MSRFKEGGTVLIKSNLPVGEYSEDGVYYSRLMTKYEGSIQVVCAVGMHGITLRDVLCPTGNHWHWSPDWLEPLWSKDEQTLKQRKVIVRYE